MLLKKIISITFALCLTKPAYAQESAPADGAAASTEVQSTLPSSALQSEEKPAPSTKKMHKNKKHSKKTKAKKHKKKHKSKKTS